MKDNVFYVCFFHISNYSKIKYQPTRDNVYLKKKILVFFLVHEDTKKREETP